MSSLASALLVAQKNFPPIAMDSTNPHFKNKFASLGAILHAILPVLNDNGLVLVQHPTIVDGQPALRTCLIHAESSEHIEDTMLLVLDKQNSQGQGSALSYARRYAVMSTLGLVADEDDDGAAASKPRQTKAAAPRGGGDPPKGSAEPPPPISRNEKTSVAKPANDPDFPFEAKPSEKPDPKVLTEIRKFAADLVEDKSSEGQELRERLAKLDWRTDPTEAQMAVSALRIFFGVPA